jgi:RNA polymerase subunit RPABC4/transcription elongation factor Spt4
MVFAVFGINSSGLNLAINMLILCLVITYLALIFWTYMDAQRRVADPMLVACATAASMFPFIGTIVYTLVRPPEFLEDVRERELEMQAAEARLAGMNYELCSHCDTVAEKDFLRCPKCLRKLRDPCVNCHRPLDPDWKLCPYCESEIPGVVAERRARRRRAPADGQTEPYALD